MQLSMLNAVVVAMFLAVWALVGRIVIRQH